ncbi:restriction endonuclease subunit S [Bifidobacterium imperatoris]|nr:restriction endonuclease subunit S [Bifidobacterium imperatoris]PLS25676.1 restriction endonuclease BgcI [Bifidobacterium imperatoris]
MLSLNDREWKTFTVEDIFKVSSGKRLETRNKVDGNRPFVGASFNGNGITGFVGNDNVSRDRNVLGVSYNGAPCVAFYHPYECLFTDDVKRLHLKNYPDNEKVLLFFVAIFAQQREKYSYGYKFNAERMLRQKIMLPVNDSGDPDWQFMEDYMRERDAIQLRCLQAFLNKRIAGIERVTAEHVDVSEAKWDAFVVGDICDVDSGRDIYAAERIVGNMPYVTAGTVNNGIGYFVGNDNETKTTGAISVSRNGANVGRAFYHPYEALYGNDCRRLTVKGNDSPYVSLFLTQCIASQRNAFSYSRKLGTARLKQLKVMLPASETGEPDYELMENYMRGVTLKHYKRLLKYTTDIAETPPSDNPRQRIADR